MQSTLPRRYNTEVLIKNTGDDPKNEVNMELKELIFSLCSLMTVTGSEYRATDKLKELVGKYFDEISTDRVGNVRLIKRSADPSAPLAMIDAHFDEIGMMVNRIEEGGFVGVTSIGGIDLAILQASDVLIYGKETIRGVVGSTPPHLRKASDSDKLVELADILIDTGYEKEPVLQPRRFGSVRLEKGRADRHALLRGA